MPALSPPSATLVALIGALLLAIGVGVLIGRSSSGQSSDTASRVSTVYLSGPGASAAAAAPVIPTVVPRPAAKGATPAATAKKTPAAKATPPATTPPAKAVHVGSPGSGPGYQQGKFTGNFFGGG